MLLPSSAAMMPCLQISRWTRRYARYEGHQVTEDSVRLEGGLQDTDGYIHL